MKLRCKKRPYASDQSLVLKIFKYEVTHLADAIESGKHFERVFEQSLNGPGSIEQSEDPKPLVGIVGEIYVRCNAFANQDVIESIERYGGRGMARPSLRVVLIHGISSEMARQAEFWRLGLS